MNEKQKKNIVGLLTVALFACLIVALTTSEIPMPQVLKYALFCLAFFTVPLYLIFGIHYWILGRILHNPHPFEHFKLGYFGPQLQNPGSKEKHFHAFRFYTLSIFASIFTFISVHYLLQRINAIQFSGDAVTKLLIGVLTQWLLIAPTATVLLLTFSKKTLSKPIKETWKAILTAGFAAGTFAVIYALFFYHFVLPLVGM